MHPTDRQLIEHVVGGERGALPAELGSHLEGACDRCAERIREYELILTTLRTDRDAEPPATWVQRAVALIEPTPVLDRVKEWCAGLREQIGRVAFDSFATDSLAFAGIRSIESMRRLRLESDDVELDLQIEPSGRGASITGEVLGRGKDSGPLAHARYLITIDDSLSLTGETDEFGEFVEETPRRGVLRIRIVAQDRLSVFLVPESTDSEQ